MAGSIPLLLASAWEELRTVRSLGFLAILFCGLSVGVALRASAFDDPWITYRVAQNLAAGNGFVYNVGERLLVTTTPLYTLLLAGFALLGLPVPHVSTVFSILGLAVGGALIYMLLVTRVPLVIAAVAGLLYLLFPLLPTAFGMETNFYMALALGAIYLYMSGRTFWAAVLLALATLTRMDAVILVAVLLVYHLLRMRRFPYRETLLYVGLCAPWFVFSQVYFGSPVPSTLGAKLAQLRLGWFPTFLPGSAQYLRWALEPASLRLYLLALMLLGLLQGIRSHRFALPIIGWGLLYALAYEGLRVPFYPWYLAPAMPAVVIAVALGLTLPLERLKGQRQRLTSAFLIGLLSAPLLVSGLVRDADLLRSGPDARVALYREVGEWLRENAQPDAHVEAMEIGAIGYYAERPMVDFAGLTRPQVVKRLEKQDVSWSLFHFWPEFVVLLDENPFDQYLQSDDRFKRFYSRVKRFNNPNSSMKNISVFRLWSAVPSAALVVKPLGNRFDTIKIVRVEAERLRVKAGEEVRLGLYWRPLASQDRDYSTFVHLLDEEWKMYAQSDNPISTTQWEVGQTYKDYHLLKVPDGIPGGTYWLNIGIYQAEPFQNLKTKGEDGLDTTSLRVFEIQVAE